MTNRLRDAGKAFERQWRARFERLARTHRDDAGIAGWSNSGLDARVRRFLSLWAASNDRHGEMWCDAGCGAGTYTRLLVESGATAIGVDYSLPAIQQARERETAHLYLVGDITKLPVVDESLDGILCFGVTQTLSTSSSATSELVRVLKPHGELWIDGLNFWSIVGLVQEAQRRARRRRTRLRYERPSHLCSILRQAGMTSVELHWLPVAPQRARWLQHIFDHPLTVKLFAACYPLASLFSHSFIVRARRSDSRATGAAAAVDHG